VYPDLCCRSSLTGAKGSSSSGGISKSGSSVGGKNSRAKSSSPICQAVSRPPSAGWSVSALASMLACSRGNRCNFPIAMPYGIFAINVCFVIPAAVAFTPRNDNGQVNLQPEPTEEMNCRGGPRFRLATAMQEVQATDQQLEGEDHRTENETSYPAILPKDQLRVAREQLQAIHASEMEDKSKVATATDGKAATEDTTEVETEKKDIDKIRGNGKDISSNKTGRNTTGKTVVSRSIRWIEDESTEWMLTVPLWLEVLLRVIGTFVGAMVVYFLHNYRYRAVHGCATVFCILLCCPCGFLTLCCPIDEATPEFNDEKEEEEIPTALQPDDAEELNEQIETRSAELAAGMDAPPHEGQLSKSEY